MKHLLDYKNFIISESFKMSNKKRILQIPKEVEILANIFKKNKFTLYVVGGAVRDFLSGKTPKDYDLATDAKPEDIDKMLAGKYNILDIGREHNVSFVIAPNGEEYEIATFREDIGTGRKPDAVKYATIDKDVLRRDLTINALYYDIAGDKIIDLVGGVNDLQSKVIKTVGSPDDRFSDDPLRKLRAVRFANSTNSKMDASVESAITKDPTLPGVSFNRMRQEFISGIKKSASPMQYTKDLFDFKLLDQMFPGIKLNMQFTNSRFWPVHIALLLKDVEFNGKFKNQLKTMAYEKQDVIDIEFIHMLLNFTDEMIPELLKMSKKVSFNPKVLTEYIELFDLKDNIIKGLFTYKPIINAKHPSIIGLKGREIGDKIKELEIKSFLQKHS